MELERNLPRSLIEQLNDETQIEVFQTWFEARGAAYFPGMTTTSLRYDKQRSELVLGRGQQATQIAVRNYYYLAQDSIPVNPESCTWAHVLDERDKAKKELEGEDRFRMRNLLGEMDKAKEEWEGKGKFRVRGGGCIERAPFLLDAIPTDNGLGLLKSALTVIFHAVQRRSDACERIFTCFSEIPDMIATGHRLAKLHPSKPEIASRLEELQNALFDSIPLLIDILLRQRGRASGDPSNQRGSLKRAKVKVAEVVKDLVRDPVKGVDDLVAPITLAVSKLKDCATMLNNEGVEVIIKRVAGLEVNDKLIFGLVKHNAIQLNRLHSKVDELSLQQDLRAPEGVLLVANELYRLGLESNRKKALRDWSLVPEQGANRPVLDYRQRESPSTRRQSGQPQLSIEHLYNVDMNHLLEVIGTDDEHLVSYRDRDRLVRMQSEFPVKALKNAYHLMESNELKSWMSSAESQLMIVDGDCLNQSKGRASPMTVLCASIAVGLATNTASPDPGMEPAGGAVLFFACSDHASPSSLLPGPRGMVRSLISQLLIARDLPWNPSRDSKDRVSYGRHPDLSFLAESSTLWPDILHYGRTCADSHSIADVSKHLQVPSVGHDKKPRSSNSPTPNPNSNADSDSDSDYDYKTGGYKSQSKRKDPAAPIAELTHLDGLIDLLIGLVRQLDPRTTVFCILDGVSYYEPSYCGSWRSQITRVVQRLAEDLWQGGSSSNNAKGGVRGRGEYRQGPRFKLLMTSPIRSSLLFGLVKNNYAGDGAQCVDMATRSMPHKTIAENQGIRHLNIPVTARPRSSSGRRDGYRRRDVGRDSREEQRYYSDFEGYFSGDRRGRGGGYTPVRRVHRL